MGRDFKRGWVWRRPRHVSSNVIPALVAWIHSADSSGARGSLDTGDKPRYDSRDTEGGLPMNEVPEAPPGFDAGAWREQLLELNPWARGSQLSADPAGKGG